MHKETNYPIKTIALLNESKQQYQRNMSLGLAVSVGIAIFVSVCLIQSHDRPRTTSQSSPLWKNNGGDDAHGPPQDLTAVGGGSQTLGSHRHSGFAGYKGYTIIPDSDPTLVEIDRSSLTSSRLYELGVSDRDFQTTMDGLSYLTVDGQGEFGLPGGGNNLIEIAGQLFPPTSTVAFSAPSERAYIKLTKRPRAANDIWVRGIVVVEFVISSKGRLLNLAVIEETPEGFGAADSLLYALGEAVFWAAKVNGRKVDTQVLFTWEYCVGNDCEDYGSVCYGDQTLIVNDRSTVDESLPPTPTGYLWK